MIFIFVLIKWPISDSIAASSANYESIRLLAAANSEGDHYDVAEAVEEQGRRDSFTTELLAQCSAKSSW